MNTLLKTSLAASGDRGETHTGRQAVILLHSSAASSRQWGALVELLRPAFDVYAVDLHGHGLQPPWRNERPLSLADEAALVLPILERVGRAHLVGHSYGGAIAMYIASRHAAKVRSLAVYEPVLFRLLADQDPQGIATRDALAVFGGIGKLMAGGQIVEAARAFVNYWSGPATWESLKREQQHYVMAHMQSVSQQFNVVCNESLPADQLTRLAMPGLCLTGTHTNAAAARIAGVLRSLMPKAEHRSLPGMGHMGPVTHAQSVNEALICFLNPAYRPTLQLTPQ